MQHNPSVYPRPEYARPPPGFPDLIGISNIRPRPNESGMPFAMMFGFDFLFTVARMEIVMSRITITSRDHNKAITFEGLDGPEQALHLLQSDKKPSRLVSIDLGDGRRELKVTEAVSYLIHEFWLKAGG